MKHQFKYLNIDFHETEINVSLSQESKGIVIREKHESTERFVSYLAKYFT